MATLCIECAHLGTLPRPPRCLSTQKPKAITQSLNLCCKKLDLKAVSFQTWAVSIREDSMHAFMRVYVCIYAEVVGSLELKYEGSEDIVCFSLKFKE